MRCVVAIIYFFVGLAMCQNYLDYKDSCLDIFELDFDCKNDLATLTIQDETNSVSIGMTSNGGLIITNNIMEKINKTPFQMTKLGSILIDTTIIFKKLSSSTPQDKNTFACLTNKGVLFSSDIACDLIPPKTPHIYKLQNEYL